MFDTSKNFTEKFFEEGDIKKMFCSYNLENL